MDAKTLAGAEEAVFAEHFPGSGQPGGPLRDGLVDPGAWLEARPRVVFIVKDIDRGRGQTEDAQVNHLPKLLRDGPRGNPQLGGKAGLGPTWNPVLRWLVGMETIVDEQPIPGWYALDETTVERRPDLLRRVCAVSLDKGGPPAPTSKRGAARALAARREGLRAQFALYRDAELFVCCGQTVMPWVTKQGVLPVQKRMLHTDRGVPYTWTADGMGRLVLEFGSLNQRGVPAAWQAYAFLDAFHEMWSTRM